MPSESVFVQLEKVAKWIKSRPNSYLFGDDVSPTVWLVGLFLRLKIGAFTRVPWFDPFSSAPCKPDFPWNIQLTKLECLRWPLLQPWSHHEKSGKDSGRYTLHQFHTVWSSVFDKKKPKGAIYDMTWGQ